MTSTLGGWVAPVVAAIVLSVAVAVVSVLMPLEGVPVTDQRVVFAAVSLGAGAFGYALVVVVQEVVELRRDAQDGW